MPKIVGNITGPNAAAPREFSVRNYKALGDNSTNDAAAITATIAAAAAVGAGSVVRFPRGTYVISTALSVTSGVILKLDDGAIIKAASGFSAAYLIGLNANCKLLGGEIDGINSSGATVVEVLGNDVTVEGVKVSASTADTTHGINASNGYHRTRIRNNHVINGYCGIRLAAVGTPPVASPYLGVEISGNLVDQSGESGTAAANPSGIIVLGWLEQSRVYSGVRIVNNTCLMRTVSGAGAWSRGIGITARMCHGGSIVGNTTEDGSIGISADRSNAITVSGNTARRFHSIGLESAQCSNATITGNTADADSVCLNSCVAIDAPASTVSDYIVVSGNTMRGLAATSNGCVYVTGSTLISKVVVSGNTMHLGSSQAGVYLSNVGGHVVVTGNLIDGGGVANGRGVFVFGNSVTPKGVVSGNYFVNLTLAGVYFNAASAVSPQNWAITGNTFNGATPVAFAGSATRGTNFLVANNDNEAGSVALTDGATINTNVLLGSSFRVTLGGNRTMANPTSPSDGQRIVYEIIQDATGSRTLTWGSAFAFGTDVPQPTLTTTASKRDFITFVYNSTAAKWYCVEAVKGY